MPPKEGETRSYPEPAWIPPETMDGKEFDPPAEAEQTESATNEPIPT